MAAKSRFPNVGKARKFANTTGKHESSSSATNESKKQITLSRFFKIPSKQVPSGSSYDCDSEMSNNNGANIQNAGKVKRPPRKRSRSQSSSPSSSQINIRNEGGNKKVKTDDISQERDITKIPPTLASSTLSVLKSFSAPVSGSDNEKDKSKLFRKRKDKHCSVTGDSEVILGSVHDGNLDDSINQEKEKAKLSCPRTSKSDNPKVAIDGKKEKKYTSLTNKVNLTPLEKQVMELKEQTPDAILFIECGYRYRFFDKDAEIASKELNICAFPDHNYVVASIPTHRLFVHARRLVAKGYKVGVVKQTETAAIKASGANKGAPFERQLTALYTKSTMIGEDLQTTGSAEMLDTGESSSFLLCICEDKRESKSNSPTEIGIVAIQPSTGDIIYDCFHDNYARQELETRVHHIKPVEMLLPKQLSEKTEKLLKGILSFSMKDHDRIRVERFPEEHFDKNKAFEEVTSFFSKTQNDKDTDSLQVVLHLPVPVLCCLSALIYYLREFHLDRIIKQTRNLKPFSDYTRCMKLNSCAIKNLEIFTNQVDGKTKGSLLWVIDHTRTSFGRRELTRWLSQPLMDVSEINQRQDAIQELLETPSQPLSSLKDFLFKAPGLEKSLCSIYHKKCSPAEFVNIMESLTRLQQLCSAHADYAKEHIKSRLLLDIFQDVPSLLEDIEQYCNALDVQAAKDGDKTRLFNKPEEFPSVKGCMLNIKRLTSLMDEHRRKVRLLLRMPALSFVTVSGYEYLIEVRNSSVSSVPGNWKRISMTKQVSRFRPPFVEETFKELCIAREKLVKACHEAWLQFLESFGEKFVCYRQAVRHLAIFDCLLSLSEVAKQDGFCRPEILDGSRSAIHIENGRHPVVSALLGEGEQYVPNSTHLEGDKERFMSITGPNMGGKSSYLKQVALIVILAQMGSYVPADRASISPMDAIYTRMGASDNIFKHQSTFMVEMMETTAILDGATSKSLVILDELGRGTSTHDGVAIAYAAAKYLITEVRCLTLFVTHYPPLAELELEYPSSVGNYHMAFLINNEQDTDEPSSNPAILTFLYQLVQGAASRSYGLNVARLADLPVEVLKSATKKSCELEEAVLLKRKRREHFVQLWQSESEKVRALVASL